MRLYTVFLFPANCFTCFGRYLHPSSGAHVTVITASGTDRTVLLLSVVMEEGSNIVRSVPDAVITVYMCS